MAQSFRRPLIAGVLLLVVALIVSACGASGSAAPSATTPSGPVPSSPTVSVPESSLPTASAVTSSPSASNGSSSEATATSAVGTGASESPLATATEMTGTTGSSASGAATPSASETVTSSTTISATTSGAGSTSLGGSGISNVTYTATEYSYSGPDQVPAGWTQLTLDNQGKESHDLMLYKIDAGKTLQDVTQALAGNGPPDWAHAYGSVTAEPGAKASYLVDLQPGTYVMLSFGQNQQNGPDAAKGMLKLVTVAGTAPAASSMQLPSPDYTINMVDYRFEVTGTLKSGTQTVLLRNSGTELHEAQVVQLKPGTTFEQFQKVLMASNGQQESQIPATPVFGMTLSPGASAYTQATLTPGDYAIVCFLPSAKNDGKPHFDLGMITSVTVK
jgi:hypothetical protein